MISSGEELREDSKLTDKDDSRGNQMHESAQGSLGVCLLLKW